MKGDLIFQHYLVVFLDILGQRGALRKVKDLPRSDAEMKKFLPLIKESLGRVLQLRDSFKNYFDGISTHTPDVMLVAPENREEFLASQKTDILFYGLSDALIIAVPLMIDDENCTAINGVYAAFTATCGIGLLFLSLGIPVRAGLDVGVATQIDEKEIYGPALERAYWLESKLAEYPRFLVGMELIAYLQCVERQEAKTRLGLIAKSMATYCRNMLITDGDGRIMLDFLGKKVKEAAADVSLDKHIESAWRFVDTQYTRFVNEEDDLMASRYFRLRKYFEARKAIWGI